MDLFRDKLGQDLSINFSKSALVLDINLLLGVIENDLAESRRMVQPRKTSGENLGFRILKSFQMIYVQH